MNKLNADKLNVLLDLDQTLISAEPTEECDLKKVKDKAKKFTFHNMDGYYVVFERPGLQEFLTFLFDNFNVSVWTAASQGYAVYIIDKIILADKNRKLDYIFFAYHCDISENKKKGTKDLSMLWDFYKLTAVSENTYKPENTIILDDYDEVHETQIGNCIRVPEFQFTKENSDKDDFLPKLTAELRTLDFNYKKDGKVEDSVKEINRKYEDLTKLNKKD
jgi:TFIIF-interacting CTD phosphatase-like protein